MDLPQRIQNFNRALNMNDILPHHTQQKINAFFAQVQRHARGPEAPGDTGLMAKGLISINIEAVREIVLGIDRPDPVKQHLYRMLDEIKDFACSLLGN
uniref:Uncharacterized protein n=1 Tax=Panagrolaimus sp. JU765 TaxID=591449 RepID=A0AC34PYL4_9BILA